MVIGSSGVGQAVIQGARIAGAARIIAVDPLENKRSAALGSGATDTIDPTSADLVDEVRRLTGGRGADYTFEVVGDPTTITQAWDIARRGGTVALVGMPAADAMITMPAFSLASDDKRLCGSLLRRYAGPAGHSADRGVGGDRAPRSRVDGHAPRTTARGERRHSSVGGG